ncbi:MAG: alpha/beta fold hydrolase, partial [Thermocrispum sp.]
GLIAAGQRAAAVELMLSQLVGMPSDTLAELRTDPAAWQPMLAAVHTLPRELRSVGAFAFDAARYRPIEVPTVLLCGDASPPELHTGVHLLGDALEQARLVTMPGVDHEAISADPDTLSATLTAELAAAPTTTPTAPRTSRPA